MEEYSVRRATQGDIPRIIDLLVQVNMVHHKGRPDLFKGPTTKYTEEELAELLQREDSPVFVCVDGNDRVLGHAFCQILQNPPEHNILTDIKTLYIDDICVDEAARGRHIGNKLCDHVIGFAKETGCYNITLNVWTLNEGAKVFYERCGFVPQKIGMEMILI